MFTYFIKNLKKVLSYTYNEERCGLVASSKQSDLGSPVPFLICLWACHVFSLITFSLIPFSLINDLVWRAFPAVLAGFSSPLIRLEVPEIPTSVLGLLPRAPVWHWQQ